MEGDEDLAGGVVPALDGVVTAAPPVPARVTVGCVVGLTRSDGGTASACSAGTVGIVCFAVDALRPTADAER